MSKIKPGRVVDLVVIALFLATAVAIGCIHYLGDWENHAWGLKLAERILWGSWLVVVLATTLTKATIFGWSFRQYFRWERPEPLPPSSPRPTAAPWYKSPAWSFSFTVTLVSVTGAIAVAALVLWILGDVIGEETMWFVLKLLGAIWWVLVVALVLWRVTVFGFQKERVRGDAAGQTPAPPAPPT